MRTLIIEDDITTASMLRECIENSDVKAEIVVCSNAEDGLAQYLAEPFPLIILDLTLPGMDGVEFCKKIRMLPNGDQCHIIAETAEDPKAYLQPVLAAGANDYIAKPYDIDAFLFRLKFAKFRIEELKNKKQAVQLLEESQDTARALLDASLDLIFLLDTEGLILDCNMILANLNKTTHQELIGTSIWKLISSEVRDQRKANFQKAIREKQPLRFEDNGEDQWYEYIIYPVLKNETVVRVAVVARDITQKKKMELSLIKAKEVAEISSRTKSEFLANMRHEINTPLNAIVGFGQLLLKYSQKNKLPDSVQEKIKTMIDCSHSLSELITNILHLADMESGRTVVNNEDLDLKQLFKGIYHVQKRKADQKELIYNYQYDDKLPSRIITDRGFLNEIILSLTSNAIKFTPEGKSVQLNAKRDRDFFVFEVIDEGIGISDEQQQNIFNIFEQVDSSTTRQYEGVGIGLPVARKMVELLGGTLSVESNPGKGSIFTASIPLIEACSDSQSADFFVSTEFHFSKDNIVLIADDIPINQKLIKTVFENLDIKHYIANNGKEAVNLVIELSNSGQTPDIILMDMFMPYMDGFEATKKIRSITSIANIPIIGFSADNSLERRQEIERAGLNGFVTKPIKFKELLPFLMQYLKQDSAPTKIRPHQSVSKNVLSVLKPQYENAFNKLYNTSIFETEKLIDQIDHIKSISDALDSTQRKLLEKLEEPAINADEEELKQLTLRFMKTMT